MLNALTTLKNTSPLLFSRQLFLLTQSTGPPLTRCLRRKPLFLTSVLTPSHCTFAQHLNLALLNFGWDSLILIIPTFILMSPLISRFLPAPHWMPSYPSSLANPHGPPAHPRSHTIYFAHFLSLTSPTSTIVSASSGPIATCMSLLTGNGGGSAPSQKLTQTPRYGPISVRSCS